MGWDKVPSNMKLWVYLEKFFYRLYDFLSQNKQTMTLQRCFLLVFTGTMSWEDAVLLWIWIDKKITLNFLFSDHLKPLCERSNRRSSESFTMETDIYIWH